MAIIGNTFNETYENYKDYYIRQNGVVKFEKAYAEIVNHSKFKRLMEWSRTKRDYLAGGDYSNMVNSIFYFMFKGNETTAMGVLIAIKYWNDHINAYMMLCPDSRVNEIATKQLRQYCLNLVMRANL